MSDNVWPPKELLRRVTYYEPDDLETEITVTTGYALGRLLEVTVKIRDDRHNRVHAQASVEVSVFDRNNLGWAVIVMPAWGHLPGRYDQGRRQEGLRKDVNEAVLLAIRILDGE